MGYLWVGFALIIVFGLLVWPGRLLRRGFNSIVHADGEDPAASLYKLFFLALVVLVAVYGYAFYHESDTSKLGTFGDFVGGAVNPILTFLTFLGLLITIILQHKALKDASDGAKETRELVQSQLKSQNRQSFEATFFQMLNLHNTIVNSMDITRKTGGMLATGRDCFKFMSEQLKASYHFPPGGVAEDDDVLHLQVAYVDFWKDWQQDLGHYFRYLYNVIRFIDNANVGHNRYMKLLRAQLSDYELLLIFYNALTPTGANFKHYIEKYTLLDNLPKTLLYSPAHENLISASAFKEPNGVPYG